MRIKDWIVDYISRRWLESIYLIGYRYTTTPMWNEKVPPKFSILKPSFRYWYADPIPFTIKGNDYVFVEMYDRFSKIGKIGVSEIKNGKMLLPKLIINNRIHMSFPSIFEYKKNIYMVPEASESECILVYKMGETVWDWKLYKSININTKIVDIIAREDNDKIILLGGVLSGENLLKTHRMIIVLDNLDNSNDNNYEIGYVEEKDTLYERNAGRILNKGEKTYLVTQESTNHDYGMYLQLHEILSFDKNSIITKYLSTKTVNDYNISLNRVMYRTIGTHTYGYIGSGLEVIDIAGNKLSMIPFVNQVKKYRIEKRKKKLK